MVVKKSELSTFVRHEIIFLRKRGEIYRKIGKALKLSFSTVRHVIKKYEETATTENRPRSGRPKVLTVRLGAHERFFQRPSRPTSILRTCVYTAH